MFRCIGRLLILAILCCAFIFIVQFWLNSKTYVFSESAIARLAEKNADKYAKDKSKDVKTLYNVVYKELKLQYPSHILPEEDLQWLFINAGGWMGSICILHASITEYVLFFGTALDTTGHSGRYWANVTDTILTGEFHQWTEGTLGTRIHKPGATVKHVSGEVASVHFKGGTWAVEYGRGFIPSTLGFALADTIFSTQDFVTLFYILRVYAKALMMEAGHYLTHPAELFST